MRKLLDNLHPRNFNHENPGSMLNREKGKGRKSWFHAAKSSGYTVVYLYFYELIEGTMEEKYEGR